MGLDVQHVRRQLYNTLLDTVWSANMEGGFFRSKYNYTSHTWDPWTEHLPGWFAFGTDAFKADSEYVLAATGTMGLWYAQNPANGGSWLRPNESAPYPAAWEAVLAWTRYCVPEYFPSLFS